MLRSIYHFYHNIPFSHNIVLLWKSAINLLPQFIFLWL